MHLVGCQPPTQPLEERDTRFDEEHPSSPMRCADKAWQVCQIRAIEIDSHDVSNPKMGQPFVQERATAAHADDPDLQPAKNLLTYITEHPGMPVIHRIGMPRARGWARTMGPMGSVSYGDRRPPAGLLRRLAPPPWQRAFGTSLSN